MISNNLLTANASNELTILIVAHRISTLKNCEQIIELGKDGIQQIGTYNSIFQK